MNSLHDWLTCSAEGASGPGGASPPAPEGFDYMKAGNDRSHAEAMTQEYMTKLVNESAPASYLPMLASLVQAPLLPLPLKVQSLFLQLCTGARNWTGLW